MTGSPRALTFDLWGGRATVLVADPSALKAAVDATREVIADVDEACSAYRDDSALSRVNARAGVPVSAPPTLLAALTVALDAAARTGGLVDPLVGRLTLPDRPAVAGWSVTTVPVVAPRATGGWRDVVVDPGMGTVRIPAGTALDLGATAKAWAADRCAAAAAAATGGSGVLVSLAGDLATAGSTPAEGWLVRVTDDHRSDPSTIGRPGVTVRLDEGGLATSSITVRRRRSTAGRTVAHVVDPRSGLPVESCWRTATVAAGSCAEANLASTAAIVLGDQAPGWLAERDLPARLVARDGHVMTVGGWPAEPTTASTGCAEPNHRREAS